MRVFIVDHNPFNLFWTMYSDRNLSSSDINNKPVERAFDFDMISVTFKTNIRQNHQLHRKTPTKYASNVKIVTIQCELMDACIQHSKCIMSHCLSLLLIFKLFRQCQAFCFFCQWMRDTFWLILILCSTWKSFYQMYIAFIQATKQAAKHNDINTLAVIRWL